MFPAASNGTSGGSASGQRVSPAVRDSVAGYLALTSPRPNPVFSLGDHRRRILGPSANLPPDYFNAAERTPETDKMRTEVRLSLENEIAKYFRENIGQVAIFDANVSRAVVQLSLHPPWLTTSSPSERDQGGADSAPAKV